MSFEESCCANDGLSISRRKTYFPQNGASSNIKYEPIVIQHILSAKAIPCL